MKILLAVYDNDSYIHCFPLGIAYIAAVLKKEGHDVQIYNQDVHHYPEEHLTEYLNKNHFDVIGIGVIAGYYQYRKLLKLSEAINNAKNKPVYILGGHGPAPEPDFFLDKTKADVIVIGEGESTIIELLNALENKRDLKLVKGIAFRDGTETHITERRQLIENIDSIPFPAYELFPMEYYRLMREPHISNSEFSMQILSGRGCIFECNFCYRMDKGHRPRNNGSIIEEINLLKKNYAISYINFMDELLMSSKERTIKFCEDLIKSKVNIKWFCNGRLNFATKEVLKIMREAGCVFINYGIECMDDQILKNMKKSLNIKQITNGIEETLAAGISPGYNIIFGNIGENKETLNKGVEFLIKYDDCAQFRTIRPVTPYPGSPLYYYALEKGLIKDVEDFYENKHLNSDLLSVNFTELSDEEFYISLMEANKRLINNYYEKKTKSSLIQAENLYLERDINFRGFRQT